MFLQAKLLLRALFSMLNLNWFILFFSQFIARLRLNCRRLKCIRQLRHLIYLAVFYRQQRAKWPIAHGPACL